jgi:hypothetical protein
LAASCGECGSPVGDQGYLCTGCSDQLARMLGDLVGLLAEVETTATRQAVMGSDGGRKSAETPLPLNWRAAELLDQARTVLTTWARDIWESSTPPAGPHCVRCAHPSCQLMTPPAPSNVGLIGYLIRHIAWMRQRAEAVELFRDVRQVRHGAMQVIDRPPEQLYAGPCDACGEDLYCQPGAALVRCRTTDCRSAYDVQQRREWLLAAAEDYLATALMISRAVTSLGMPVTYDRIRKWASRDRIAAHSVDRDGRPLYRVGDVLAILQADLVRQAEKAGSVA